MTFIFIDDQLIAYFFIHILAEGSAGMQIGYSKCPNATNFNAEELKLHKDCEAKKPGITLTEFILYAICFSLLFPIGYFLNEYVVNRFRRGGESEVAHEHAGEYPDPYFLICIFFNEYVCKNIE